jgi:DNA-binding winged helix-turn-helix (wHTH) protein
MSGSERSHTIGDWTFFPASHELIRGDERIRLEHRAAAILDHLCAHRGEVASRAALTALVWGDRHVSANSLPTAIHAIRRALGDDSKNPIYLETVAKGGYRIIAQPAVAPRHAGAAPSPGRDTRRFMLTAGGLALLGSAVAGVAAIARVGATPPVRTLALTRLTNQTGEARFDVLAYACEGVLVSALSRHPRFRISRDVAERGDIRVATKLVLWSGLPDVLLEAQDASSTLLWSGFASGPEDAMPSRIEAMVTRFVTSLTPQA